MDKCIFGGHEHAPINVADGHGHCHDHHHDHDHSQDHSHDYRGTDKKSIEYSIADHFYDYAA